MAIIAIPQGAFNITQAAWVYNDETLVEQLPQLEDEALFPRLANANNVVSIRSRHLMFLPSKYVHLLHDNRGYTPKEAWDHLLPAFQADNFLEAANPIIKWLRLTLHATQNNNRGTPTTTFTLVAPDPDQDLAQPDQDLAQHCQLVLTAALPYIHQQQDPDLHTAVVQMANAITTQANEARTA